MASVRVSAEAVAKLDRDFEQKAVLAKLSKAKYIQSIVGMNYSTYRGFKGSKRLTGKQYEKLEQYLSLEGNIVIG